MNDLGVKLLREMYAYRYMTSFVKSAKVLEKNIHIKTVKYIAGEGYRDNFDIIETCPIGTWGHIHAAYDSLRYEQFLDTMVHKTIETRRKMALIALENALCENKNIRSLVRIMHSVKILDPTFTPPIINMICSWQKRLVYEICMNELPKVINTSTNEFRLERFFRTMQLIETETPHPITSD